MKFILMNPHPARRRNLFSFNNINLCTAKNGSLRPEARTKTTAHNITDNAYDAKMGSHRVIILLILFSTTAACYGFVSHANNNDCKHKLPRACSPNVLQLMMATSATGEITSATQRTDDNYSNLQPLDAFQLLIQKAIHTLIMSDTDGEELDHSYGSASQGLWVHPPSAKELQNIIDRLVLKLKGSLHFGDSHIDIDNKSVVSEIDDEATNCGDNMNQTNHSSGDVNDKETIPQDGFQSLISSALHALIKSDVVCGDRTQYGSSTQGRWMFDPAAKDMQNILDRLVIPQENPIDSITSNLEDELCNQWVQWMKTTPSPLFLDLTTYIHEIIAQNHNTEDQWVPDEHLKSVDTSLEQYISRIACHVILLPSGSETAPLSLCESTGSHIYGKLLYGGVNRFRLLKSGQSVRRVGERREVMNSTHNSHPSWVQLGGVERKYEALDIGSAALLELTLLPRLWQDIPTIFDKNILSGAASKDMIMSHTAVGWDPSTMLQLLPKEEESSDSDDEAESSSSIDILQSLEGEQRNEALSNHFEMRVGGLQPQIDAIVRRVLDGRSIYATTNNDKKLSRQEAEELLSIGLQPVRGLLLYGRPGTGKTLIVREIARLISSRPPKIVSASELLDRWVGGSEKLVRELFKDAEEELKMCQMTSSPGEEDTAFLNSALHVIVIDEIDAVFRARNDASITQNSVVNQLLSKLDGINALPNVLMIGMTNRRELLDPALLRPGRLEVQLEIPMPGKDERREILNIHFAALRKKNRLSYPLRCAIDGVSTDNNYGDHNPEKEYKRKETGRKRRALKRAASNILSSTTRRSNVYDLASETDGYSGADLEGLVRCAGSIALSRARVDGGGVESLLITLDDVKQALKEVKP